MKEEILRTTKTEFLEIIEKFLKNTGMSCSAFGKKAKGDPNFVFDIRNGRECGEKIKTSVAEFMERYQHEQAK